MNHAYWRRRDFLGAAAGSLAAAFAGTARADTPLRRPNILWLSTEDMSAHLGCYGDERAITPSIDRLAAEGQRFTRAFTAAPVCAPNRSCIITGVYASTLGTHMMRSGGEGVQRSNLPVLPDSIRCFPEYLRNAGYYCTNNVKEDFNFVKPPETWDESSNTAHWRHRKDASQPFFAVFNFTGTHEGTVRQAKEKHLRDTARLTPEQRQNPDTIVPPPYHPNTAPVREQWAQYYEQITALDYWVADRLRELEEDGLAENTIVFFWSDHGMGLPRGKRWLYDSGVHVPVIVRAPEAWREFAGVTPGRVDHRLISSVDFAPTVLRLASVTIPAHMQGQPFLGPDQPKPRAFVYAARDRMDNRYDCFRLVRDERYSYIRNYMPFLPYGQWVDYGEQSPIMRDLRRLQREEALTEHTRWIDLPRKPLEELYDNDADPHALKNLAEHPEHQRTLARMRAEHARWMRDTRDLGLLPEPELNALGVKCGSRYAIAESMEREQPGFLSKIRAAAVLAGAPGIAEIPALGDAAQSPIPSVRWWGVQGLRQAASVEITIVSLLREKMRDDATTVRVAAAEALAHTSEDDRPAAIALLVTSLASSDEWIRLQAALALDNLGTYADSAVPALQKALEDKENKYVVRVANHALNALLGTNNDVP